VKIFDGVISKRIKDWKLPDFAPLADPIGRSVLISLFVDFSHAIQPGGLTDTHRRLVANLTKPKICTAVHIFLENILEHPRPSENIIYIFSLNNILCVRYTYYFVRQ
jgi:hypothetical protein